VPAAENTPRAVSPPWKAGSHRRCRTCRKSPRCLTTRCGISGGEWQEIGTVRRAWAQGRHNPTLNVGVHRKIDAEEPVGNDDWHPAFASVGAQPAPALGAEGGGLKQAPYRSWRTKGPEMDPTDNLNKRANMHVFLTLLFLVFLAPLVLVLSGRTFWLGEWSRDGGSATVNEQRH